MKREFQKEGTGTLTIISTFHIGCIITTVLLNISSEPNFLIFPWCWQNPFSGVFPKNFLNGNFRKRPWRLKLIMFYSMKLRGRFLILNVKFCAPTEYAFSGRWNSLKGFAENYSFLKIDWFSSLEKLKVEQ